MGNSNTQFALKDVSEIVIGSTLLAFPVAISEEVWDLGKVLSPVATVALVLASLFFLAWFGYHKHYQSRHDSHIIEFIIRVLSVYVITLVVAALILVLFDQFPLATEPSVAIKRMVIVALPASFCATVVDSLR